MTVGSDVNVASRLPEHMRIRVSSRLARGTRIHACLYIFALMSRANLSQLGAPQLGLRLRCIPHSICNFGQRVGSDWGSIKATQEGDHVNVITQIT